MKKFIKFFLAALIFVFVCDSAWAEITNQFGSTFRLRHEYWQNWKDMDNGQLDNRNYFRIRSSVWDKVGFNKDTELYVRLTNEFKAYTYFAGTSGSVPDKSASKKGYHFDINEIVFDNLYVTARNLMNAPVDLVIGRQDLINVYAEGFMIQDGTPQDGSRTFYFNAAKGSWRANEKNTLDLVCITDTRDEEYLPVINRVELPSAATPALDKAQQPLNTTDEQGIVLDWKNKSIDNLLLEGYYIFKKEAEEGGLGYQSQQSDIYAPGAFVRYDFGSSSFRGQWAGEFGNYGNNDRLATGGYAFLDHSFKDARWSPKASAGFIYLSGNDPASDTNEAWDPLFSRYSWFSDLYSLSMSSETGITNYWTNLEVWRMGAELNLSEKMKLSFNYNFMRAAASVAKNAVFSGDGLTRGHLLQGRLDHKFNKTTTAYILMDYLIPGDFYQDHDPAIFLRTEIQFKF